MSAGELTRRDVIKKAVYTAPVILTLPAVLSVASAGSGVNRASGPAAQPTAAPGSGGCSWWEFWCW